MAYNVKYYVRAAWHRVEAKTLHLFTGCWSEITASLSDRSRGLELVEEDFISGQIGHEFIGNFTEARRRGGIDSGQRPW